MADLWEPNVSKGGADTDKDEQYEVEEEKDESHNFEREAPIVVGE